MSDKKSCRTLDKQGNSAENAMNMFFKNKQTYKQQQKIELLFCTFKSFTQHSSFEQRCASKLTLLNGEIF